MSNNNITMNSAFKTFEEFWMFYDIYDKEALVLPSTDNKGGTKLFLELPEKMARIHTYYNPNEITVKNFCSGVCGLIVPYVNLDRSILSLPLCA